jgi:hypothetical protein
MLQFIPVIGGLIETIGGVFEKWQERKLVKAEGKVAVEKAKVEGEIKKVQTLLDGEMEYDKIAAEGMKYSWKDEWFTILLSIPVIMSFIPYPPLQAQVAIGFEILKESTHGFNTAL